MTAKRVFRAPSATIGLVIGGALALFLLGDAVLRAGWDDALLLAPWILLILWGVYEAMYASHIASDDAGVTVQNLLRITRVPWSRVTDVDLRWQLVLEVDDGTQVKSFGGPAAGRPARPGRAPAGRARREPPALRALDVLREQREGARRRGSGTEPVTRRWDLPAVAVLAVLVIWAVAAVLIVSASA